MERIAQDKIEEIVKKYDLKLLLLFGSQVSGKTHPMSDFDFGYIGKKDMSYQERGNLDDDLSRLVKGEVDTVDLKNGNPFLLKEIAKNNRVFFEENGSYADFFSTAFREYFDAEPILRVQEIIYSNIINKYRKQYAK